MEEQLIFEVWDTFREHIPEKGRGIAAEQYVDFLVSKDVDIDTFEGLMGYDSHLDSAIQLVLDEHQNNDENEYEDFEDDEEEDY
jgi:hypothetical protein